jgi:hypothetical protein
MPADPSRAGPHRATVRRPPDPARPGEPSGLLTPPSRAANSDAMSLRRNEISRRWALVLRRFRNYVHDSGDRGGARPTPTEDSNDAPGE